MAKKNLLSSPKLKALSKISGEPPFKSTAPPFKPRNRKAGNRYGSKKGKKNYG